MAADDVSLATRHMRERNCRANHHDPPSRPDKQRVTLADPANLGGDSFGAAVAVDEETTIVSAASGVYIYAKGSSGWPTEPTAMVSDPTPTMYDGFGATVGVSRDTVVVGGGGKHKVYLYVKGSAGWPTKPTVQPADPRHGYRDDFGYSVAISGGILIVGARGTKQSSGAAYIYVRRPGGSLGWPTKPTVTLANLPPSSLPTCFGQSVAVSGNTAAVGATCNGGAVYLFSS